MGVWLSLVIIHLLDFFFELQNRLILSVAKH